jgi:hypothetical protein
MLPLSVRPVGGEDVKLVFRATKYAGCDSLAFRDAVNRKVREQSFWIMVNPAVSVTGTSTGWTDNARDELFTECLVVMKPVTPNTPTYGVILEPLANFIAGAWSCWGTSGGIRLVDANFSRRTSAPTIRSAEDAAAGSGATPRGDAPPSEGLGTIRVVAYAILAVAGVYGISRILPFLPKRG